MRTSAPLPLRFLRLTPVLQPPSESSSSKPTAVCAQKAIQTLLQHESAEGASYEARLHALSQKYPSVPQSLFALCIRLGESPSKEHPALDVERLKVLVVALKIMLYEIYVLGPDRVDRLKYLQQMVEACEAGAHGQKSTVVAFPN